MSKPLEGIRIVEVAMWAFVPACGGMLSDLGADVIKIEPPTGDPLRGLRIGAITANSKRHIDYSWESYNRGKRAMALDLKHSAGHQVLMKLLEDADVFLTNLLPRARKAMRIDAETIRGRFPDIIYATGSGVGQHGPEKDKGGFDAISFWARGGVASSLSESDAEFPIGPPGPAFGDTLSGSMLAGGVCAAIARRALSGEGSEVDVSLFATSMWSMQRYICQSAVDGLDRFPRPDPEKPHNVLVCTYRTSDGRHVALNMLQADKYWAPFCEAAGRPEMAIDPRYATAPARSENLAACLAEMRALFDGKTLAEWRDILSRQEGQWDAVQNVGEIHKDKQVVANAYVQEVDFGDGTTIPMVSVPMQFDGKPLPARRAPELGANSDAILESLGYDEDAIINLKVQGVVF
jgi:crotonobetainyl-CoA:carnitine CoA-transferase CaiB-like acyl-CoA transferase